MRHSAASHSDEHSQHLLKLLLKILLAFDIWAKYRKEWFPELVWGGQPQMFQSHHHCISVYPHPGVEFESLGRSDAAPWCDSVGRTERELVINRPAFRRGTKRTESMGVCQTVWVQGWRCDCHILSLVTHQLLSLSSAALKMAKRSNVGWGDANATPLSEHFLKFFSILRAGGNISHHALARIFILFNLFLEVGGGFPYSCSIQAHRALPWGSSSLAWGVQEIPASAPGNLCVYLLPDFESPFNVNMYNLLQKRP